MSYVVLHQFLSGARSGDAITDQALTIRRWLRDIGFVSHIYAHHFDQDIEREAEIFPLSRHRRAANETKAIYHHSIGSEIPDILRRKRLRLILMYHNVTPPQYFERIDPMMAYSLVRGWEQLAEMLPDTEVALADSPFNLSDLTVTGYPNRGVLPIMLRPERYDRPVNPVLAAKLAETAPNILFVGRLVPNKAQDDLIIMMQHLLQIHPAGHLYLVGDRGTMGYDVWLEQMAQELGVAEHVTLTGKVSDDDLVTYLRGSSLYVSMSEHEGFGVPLIESMYCGLPTMAFASSAVPETLGDAGVLFFNKDHGLLAELAHTLLQDESLRRRIIETQTRHVQRYLEPAVRPHFEHYLGRAGIDRVRKRIAIVVQRYGEEVNGGAETYARELAERLRPIAFVEAITTCAVDHLTWANVYPPGESELNGVVVHRFPADAPRAVDFIEQTKALLMEQHTLFDELQWIKEQGPYSTGLLSYLTETYGFYDLYIFFTYLYAPAYFGLPLVSDKAVLVPTAHDEPYLYLPVYRQLFHLPQYHIFSTEPERQLVNRVIENHKVPQLVVGMGITFPTDVSAARFRDKYDIHEPFLIYAGRIDPGKNVPELLAFLDRFRRETGRRVKLVLLGRVGMALPDCDEVVSLGFVSEEDKFDAFQAARALVMPSALESLSIVVLEAWTQATPVLVNGRSEVLKYQSEHSGGGLHYSDYEEFAAALHRLLDDDALCAQLGESGSKYVKEHYQWDHIIAQYQMLLDTVSSRSG